MFMNDEKPKDLQECLERLKKGCETLSAECNYSEDYSQFNPPATEEEIVKFESTLKFPLPQEYREFLKFSNGARIMGEEIYGLDSIGSSDVYVPDGYLSISRVEMTSERLAISEENGKICLFWDLQKKPWDFELELMNLLEECEGLIDSYRYEQEREERRKAGITEEQERAELYAKIEEAYNNMIKTKKENNNE